MSEKPQYHTRQYDLILSYLKTIPGKHVTVQDICEHFSGEDHIGQTTVYRQMERLVASGLVQKYVLDTASACFEYVGPDSHNHDENCFHCKCKKCGKLIHLECEEIAQLESHILKAHNFTIDTTRTVFYGLCESCRD